jgi:hypothetical protein
MNHHHQVCRDYADQVRPGDEFLLGSLVFHGLILTWKYKNLVRDLQCS